MEKDMSLHEQEEGQKTRSIDNSQSERDRMRSEQERVDMSNAVSASLAEYHGGPDTTQLDWRASSASQISTYHRQCSQLAILKATGGNPGDPELVKDTVVENQGNVSDLAAPASKTTLPPTVFPREADPPQGQSTPPANEPSQDGSPEQTTSTEADTSDSKKRSSTAVENMENRMKAILKLLESQLPQIYHDDGDTLVYVDPAPQQPEFEDETYEYYTRRCALPSRMFSRSFLRLGSAYFKKAFGSSAQFRVLRRRHLVNNLPPGIKYVIDLSPPSEGDDAVYLATELSCSPSVRRWYRGRDRWKIAPTLICAPEEWMPYVDTQDSQLEKRRHYQEIDQCHEYIHDKQLRLDRISSSEISLPPDLSPVRHRSAIERILLAIDGQDPRLNSAPIMWTTAALAKYFDISGKPDDPLVDYVVRWLRASPNSLFIEAVPEETLKIADSFCNEALCRESFAILVGEQALEVECGKRGGTFENIGVKNRTIFGRNKGDIHEAYQTRIEYARAAFIERVRGEFRDLLQAEWVENLPEISTFTRDGSAELQEKVSTFIDLVKQWVRGWLYQRLSTGLNYDGPGSDFDEYLFPVNSYELTWNLLQPSERVFCRAFWASIRRGSLDGEVNSSGYDPDWRPKRLRQDPVTDQELVGLGSIRRVTKSELVDALIEYNRLLKDTRATLPYRHRSTTNLETDVYLTPRHAEALPEPQLYRPDFTCRTSDTRKDSWDRQYEPPSPPTPELSFLDNWGLVELFRQAADYIKGVSDRMLAYPGSNEGLEVELTNTLVCLLDSETKYLPLWANGNDDGSGGVFDPDVPLADHGFTDAGPRVHTGDSRASSASDFTEVGESNHSSRHTSTMVNDGFSDTLDRRRVYAASDAANSVGNDDDLWRAIRESKQVAASEAGFTSESGTGTILESSDHISRAETVDDRTRAAAEEVHRLEIAQQKDEEEEEVVVELGRIPAEAKGKGRERPVQEVDGDDDDMLDLEDMEENDSFDDQADMMTDSDEEGPEKALGDSDDEEMVMV